jgi:hypothetical protein
MSDVMTSRSIPSRGTKYSFWRADAGGIACVWLDLLLGLPAIDDLGTKKAADERRNRDCWARARRLVSGCVVRPGKGTKLGSATRLAGGKENREENKSEGGRRSGESGRCWKKWDGGAGPRKQPGAWGWAGRVGPPSAWPARLVTGGPGNGSGPGPFFRAASSSKSSDRSRLVSLGWAVRVNSVHQPLATGCWV